MKGIILFYSQADEKWKDMFVSQLGLLGTDLVRVWNDAQIETNPNWFHEIRGDFNESRAAILLISSDFLLSSLIRKAGIPELLEEYGKKNDLKVISLILRPCAWKWVKWLMNFQIFPKEGKPLSNSPQWERESILSDLVKTLYRWVSVEERSAGVQVKIRTDIKDDSSVSWHDAVLDMIKQYDEGWTENDQIDRAGKAIEMIADRLNVWDEVHSMWGLIKNWEFFGRAVSSRSRGGTHHAINVFWLGYYLINHKNLRDFFLSCWNNLKDERLQIKIVKGEKTVEAINNIWFYTGLFHDLAGCLEKFAEINHFHQEIYSPFGVLGLKVSEPSYFLTETIRNQAVEFLGNFNDPLKTQLKMAWEKSVEEQKADHGMLAALFLKQRIKDQKQNRYAREAGRAIAVHSLISRIKEEKIINLTWEKEPFACLLLLCDQLQTWERERGDTKLSDNDGPERSELADLQIEPEEMAAGSDSWERPHLKIAIDYIAPPHLRHAPQIYQRVKDDLDFILRDKPRRALNKIAGEWPFWLDVHFFLSKDPLNAFIKLPHPHEKEKTGDTVQAGRR